MTSDAAPSIEIQNDVPYLTPDRQETLDVYLPGNVYERPLPAVLLIHGGGWRVGDKRSRREQNIGNNLAAAGYAVFSINYLLNEGEKDESGKVRTTRVAWPRNFLDCQDALRFMRRESSRFGIDPQRIGVMGGSAGGSFAMLLGATSEREDMGGSPDNPVSCVINFYGVPSMDSEHRRKIFAGATPEETDENVRRASPVNWLSPDMPPLLIAHGSADTTVPVDESRKLVKLLQAKNLPYWYVEIAGAPHTFHLEPEQMDLRPVVLTFLNKHLGVPARR